MTDETMSTLTVTPSMSSQISFERFPLKGVLGVKGVLAWAHRRARALKELQIEAFYARARHPFLGGGPYVTYIFWGGWGRGGAENVTYNRRPPKKGIKNTWFRQIDQTCFQPMADPGTFSWRGGHSTGVPRSNTDVPGSASGM